MTKQLIDGIVGTRPNMMKMAPLARALALDDTFTLRLIHTGQHYDDAMSSVFLRQLGLPEPAVNFQVGSGTQAVQTGKIMAAYEDYVRSTCQPRGLVVVGDVTSTMASALTAVKLGIPIAHVEAGLRSFDRTMPEEINRLVTDAISDLLLVSDPDGLLNLAREGQASEKIHFVGNVMIDTLWHSMPTIEQIDITQRYGVIPHQYAYVTLHRPTNVDDRVILARLLALFETCSQVMPVVVALHPRTRQRMLDFALPAPSSPDMHIIDPLGYHDNIALVRSARVVLSDSGGIQEEASVLQVPCLTLRETTERPCTVELGTSELVGNTPERITAAWDRVMRGAWKTATAIPLWDGHSAERIVRCLRQAWE